MFADNVGRFSSMGCGCDTERKQVKDIDKGEYRPSKRER